MKYKDLYDLTKKNCMCRELLLAQSVYVQIELRKMKNRIHTAEELLNAVNDLRYIAK